MWALSNLAQRDRWPSVAGTNIAAAFSTTAIGSWHRPQHANLWRPGNIPPGPIAAQDLSALAGTTLAAAPAAPSANTTLRSKTIALFPTEQQKALLRQAVGTVRWTYNRVIADIRSGVTDLARLRKSHVNKEALEEQFDWALKTPARVREDALLQALDAHHVAQRKQAAGKIRRYRLHFRRRRAGFGRFVIQKDDWRGGRFFPKVWPAMHGLRFAEAVPEAIDGAATVFMRAYKWFVTIPIATNPARNTLGERVVAIDPGVTTFVTMYSPTAAQVYRWGHKDVARIYRLQKHHDDLLSRASAARCRRRWRMRRAAQKMRLKSRALVRDVHSRLAVHLERNFDVILLPQINPHHMVRRGHRVLGVPTVRNFSSWAHGRFRRVLADKVKYVPVTEEYTSRTCSDCGWDHPRLGVSKIYTCGRCGLVADRDANGAKNIFLKWIHDASSALAV
ncbi:hypothetical protein V8E36_007637 [Tilletia maclaganii]